MFVNIKSILLFNIIHELPSTLYTKCFMPLICSIYHIILEWAYKVNVFTLQFGMYNNVCCRHKHVLVYYGRNSCMCVFLIYQKHQYKNGNGLSQFSITRGVMCFLISFVIYRQKFYCSHTSCCMYSRLIIGVPLFLDHFIDITSDSL